MHEINKEEQERAVERIMSLFEDSCDKETLLEKIANMVPPSDDDYEPFSCTDFYATQEPFQPQATKETNPKDAIGISKTPISTVSHVVLAELGVAMLEGALKYGRHNYRVSGVRASVYVDAMARHLMKWYEGEDIDPDSGLSHITKIIASAFVLRDAIIFDNWVDDRPPSAPEGFIASLDGIVAKLLEKYPEPVAPFTKESKDV